MNRMMRGAALARYDEVATRLGLDPHAMLREVGLDPRFLADTEARFPSENALELLELSAARSGCETFGLLLAEARRLSDYGPISLMLTHVPTMGDAIRTLMRFQRMLNEALLIHLEDEGGETVIVREELVSGHAVGTWRQGYELALGTLAHIFRGQPGPVLKPRRVLFTHGPPADLTVHRRLFGAGVVFHADLNGIECSRQDLDAPNPSADAALVRYAEGFIRTLPFAQETSVALEVQKAIQALLPLDRATIEGVASRLGMNRRTLQRRLAEEGGEFTSLLNDIRRDHALRYLANPNLSLEQVAELVGYRRQTSFARWFTAEFGVAPSAWRAAAR
ncbi:MAG: AraC family transcriptional regulator [Phenylobacterium sp.]